MENAHQAILDSLPPRRRRSKLEPYAALIRALRARGRSYREIVTILRERCGLRVAMHTVYHFVRARAQKTRRRASSTSAAVGACAACVRGARVVLTALTRRARGCVDTHRGRQAARAGVSRGAESVRLRRERALAADDRRQTAKEVTR